MMLRDFCNVNAVLPLVVLAVSCVKPNPEYCDETRPCLDEAKPFCDLRGEYAASNYTAHLCIPDPRVSDDGSVEGAVDAGIDFTHDAGQGSPDAEPDSLSPASLATDIVEHDFGGISQGTQSTLLTVTVRNSGHAPTGTISTSVAGPNASDILVLQDACAEAVLEADENCTVQLRLAPAGVGTKSASLELSAAPGGTQTVDLLGAGLPPAALQLETALFDFGAQPKGTRSTGKAFRLRNDGDGTTGPIDVSLSEGNHYVLTQNSCVGTLAPRTSCDVTVVFVPEAVGTQNDTLIVQANPGDRTTVALGGTGTVSVSLGLHGTGQGRVTSDPAGMDCSATCNAAFSFATVILTAEAQSNSCFMGWSEGCSGRESTCALTLDRAKSVQADFKAPEVLFTLTTTATGSDAPFNAWVSKSGCTLTWDLGDGSDRRMEAAFSHTYVAPGAKTVTVLSADGGAGVTRLQLAAVGLTGPIPMEIVNLPNLEHLRLDRNSLTGSIPPGLANTPIALLSLHGNDLSGEIPAQLGSLSQLADLYLGRNALTGTIPAQLGNLSQLRELGLSENQLTGAIPAQLGNLSQLSFLALRTNELTGSIPPELGNLPELQELDLGWNELTGPIPPELGALAKLNFLGLGGNKLTGSIPADLGNLSYLEVLDLYYNQLTGTIPAQLGNLSFLTQIHLSGNQLTGVASGVFSRLTNILEIWMDNNALTQQAVDTIVDQIYQSRDSYRNTQTKVLSLEGGTNASPSASSITKINELSRDTYRWSITCNGC